MLVQRHRKSDQIGLDSPLFVLGLCCTGQGAAVVCCDVDGQAAQDIADVIMSGGGRARALAIMGDITAGK